MFSTVASEAPPRYAGSKKCALGLFGSPTIRPSEKEKRLSYSYCSPQQMAGTDGLPPCLPQKRDKKTPAFTIKKLQMFAPSPLFRTFGENCVTTRSRIGCNFFPTSRIDPRLVHVMYVTLRDRAIETRDGLPLVCPFELGVTASTNRPKTP